MPKIFTTWSGTAKKGLNLIDLGSEAVDDLGVLVAGVPLTRASNVDRIRKHQYLFHRGIYLIRLPAETHNLTIHWSRQIG